MSRGASLRRLALPVVIALVVIVGTITAARERSWVEVSVGTGDSTSSRGRSCVGSCSGG